MAAQNVPRPREQWKKLWPAYTLEIGQPVQWVVKQMRPAAHMAQTCSSTFRDALGKMFKTQAGDCAFYAAMLWWDATRKFVACMQLHVFAKEHSTRLPKTGKRAPHSAIVVASLWSSRHVGSAHPPFKTYAIALYACCLSL